MGWGYKQKILILCGFTKKCTGENCPKRGAWTVCRFKGEGLGKKKGNALYIISSHQTEFSLN